MARFSGGFRIVLGLIVMLPALYFVFVSIHLLLSSEADFKRIVYGGGLGLLMAVLGGYIISDAIAAKITAGVTAALTPFLGLIPGGRRRQDPPLEAPSSVKPDPPGI